MDNQINKLVFQEKIERIDREIHLIYEQQLNHILFNKGKFRFFLKSKQYELEYLKQNNDFDIMIARLEKDKQIEKSQKEISK
jgi:hypothetical protein